MSSVLTSPELGNTPREDFPIDSFRHLEGKLQAIRRKVMERAVEIAAKVPDEPIFTVTRMDVDQALEQVLRQPNETLAIVGLGSGMAH